MRLSSLKPRFYEAEGRQGMGLLFDCPLHPNGYCMVAVPFENPLDGGPKCKVGTGDDGKSYWTREGEDFETITLKPSINVQDVSTDDKGKVKKTSHWHGFVTKGEVSTC